VQPVLYSSKQFRLFCENFCAREDICQAFLSEQAPDTFDYSNMKKTTNELSIVENVFQWERIGKDCEYTE